MKLRVTETEQFYGHTGQSQKITLMGYTKDHQQVTITIEEDGCLKDSYVTKLTQFRELELSMTISGTKEETFKLV